MSVSVSGIKIRTRGCSYSIDTKAMQQGNYIDQYLKMGTREDPLSFRDWTWSWSWA